MERESFIFYRSFLDAVEGLSDKDRLAIFDAIIKKGLNNEDIELKGIQKNLFTLIKPQLEANNKKYLNGKKGGEYGKLGGRGKKEKPQNNPIGVFDNKLQNNPTQTPNENVNENENENVNGECKCEKKEKENFETEKTSTPQTTTPPFPNKFKKINTLDTFKEWWKWWESGTDVEIEAFCKQHEISNDMKIEVYERIIAYCERTNKDYDDYRRVYMQSLLNKKTGANNG